MTLKGCGKRVANSKILEDMEGIISGSCIGALDGWLVKIRHPQTSDRAGHLHHISVEKFLRN